jgi:tripartite ATP-independent transporter DctP family solute receptor
VSSARDLSRRTLVPLIAASLAWFACAGPSREDTRAHRFVLANVHTAAHPTGQALTLMAQDAAIDPGLAGRVEIDLQLGGVLGGEKETLEKLRVGGVQMACASAAPLAELVPEMGALILPFLFQDRDHMWRVLDGPVGEELLGALEPHGFIGLAWYDAGARSFYTRQRPVLRPEDLRGQRIRVQEAEVMREMVRLMGGAPVTLGFEEVYTSLYSGHVDGAENDLPSFYWERHFEVARHFSLDRHSMTPDLLLVGERAWRRLSPSEREALRDLALRSSMAQRGFWTEAEDEARRQVLAAGVQIHDVEGREAFRQAVAPLYQRFAPRYGGWVERLQTGQ